MKRLILFILTFAYIMPSFAQSKSDGAKYVGNWWVANMPTDYHCKGDYNLMGLSDLADAPNTWQVSYRLRNFLNHASEEYIARQITDKGARFCKTIIDADRSNCYGDPYTTYYNPTAEDCFWLCKEGYYGNECTETAFKNNDSQKKIGDFVGLHPHDGYSPLKIVHKKDETNIEDEIPMFKWDEYVGCGGLDRRNLNSSKKQEHDVVLMLHIVRETKKDEEMYMLVVPLAVRAGGTRGCFSHKANHDAWPMLAMFGETHTAVCPSDYLQRKGYVYAGDPNKGYSGQQSGCPARGVAVAESDVNKVQAVSTGHRADGKLGDCYVESRVFCIYPDVAIVETVKGKENAKNLLDEKMKHVCSGYVKDLTLYDEDLHQLLVVNDKTFAAVAEPTTENVDSYDWTGKSSLLKCKSESKAFKADWQTSGDMGCYECTGDVARFGIDNQGVCQQCVKGEIFDSNTKKCEKARVFSKNDMRFGVGNAPSADLEEQCWTKDNPTDYKNCMLGENTVGNVGSLKKGNLEKGTIGNGMIIQGVK